MRERLSHQGLIDSRKMGLHDQSASWKRPQARTSQDNVTGWVASEVSLSESEFKSSIRQSFLSQVTAQNQRNQGEIAQATVMQQRMEMMPKKHRHMIMKKTQHSMAGQDADLSLAHIDQYLIDQAFQENNAHRARHSTEPTAGLTKSKQTLVQAGSSNRISNLSNNQLQKEIAYLSDLTVLQKMRIVQFNCAETVLIFLLLANSVAFFDLGALVQFVVALMLSHLLLSQTANVKCKRVLIWTCLLTSLLSLMAKTALIALGIASTSRGLSGTQVKILESIGYKF